jgi:chemotaxis protein MotB
VHRLLVCRLCPAALLILAGCQWVPRSKLVAAESQNRVLLEQRKAQLVEIENLRRHSRTLEEQLAAAEEELALLAQRAGEVRRPVTGSSAPTGRDTPGASGHPVALARGKLTSLVQRWPGFQFDPATGAARFHTDVLFETGEARLKPEARQALNEFAALLKSPEGRELRVLLVGHTDDRPVIRPATREKYPDNWHLSAARALAVADYLQQAGVREEQIGVIGYGRHQPLVANRGPAERQRNRRVELFVFGPETPVVGWDAPAAIRR